MTQATFINLRGASFTQYFRNAFDFPIATLPDTYYLLGTDAASSARNLAVEDDDDTTTVTGTPVYGAGYATLSEANYLSNGISAAGQHTLVIVTKKASGTGLRGYMGNWLPTVAGSQSNLLYHNDYTQTHSVNGGGKATQAFDPAASFAFMAVTWDGADSKVYAHDGASMITASSAYAGGGGSVTPLRVGGISDLAAATFDCAAALRFSSALSAGDLATLYTFLKTLLATRSVTVL